MSDNLDRAKRYHVAIRELLLNEWDPIGVAQISEAADEYDSYVPMVYKMLITKVPKHELFDYLWWLETEHMGLTGDRGRTEEFTNRLLNIENDVL